jgi:hypothetical protein
MTSVVQVKAGNGRVEAYCPFAKVTAFGLVAGRAANVAGPEVELCIDDAGCQSAANPMERVAEPALAVK